MEKSTVQEIYQGLKRHKGAVKEVCEAAGCAPNWVRHVLRDGTYEDDRLVQIAAKIWAQKEEELLKRRSAVSELVNRARQLRAQNDSVAA